MAMQIIRKFNFIQQTTLMYALMILFFTCLTTEAFGKGCSGTYFISGTAYSANKTILKNVTLTVKFGKETKTVLTDSNGHFEIELTWTNACPSKRTKEQHKQDNSRINPPFIYISYANKEIKLVNEWEKFADCFTDSKDKTTWKKDLYFHTD